MRIKWNTEGASPDGFVLGPNGDTVATITHEGIGWTLRMVSPYPAATSRGFRPGEEHARLDTRSNEASRTLGNIFRAKPVGHIRGETRHDRIPAVAVRRDRAG